jgi:hypothetical protein
MMLEASGEAFNFEFAGDHVDERPLPEPACHTNHCLYRNVPAGELEANSRARIARAGALLSRSDSPGIGELKDIGREIHFRSGSDPGAAFQVYGLPQQY